jgi:hypothetical protein
MFSNAFHETPAVYEIMWNNMVEPDMPQMAENVIFACQITNARIQTYTLRICSTYYC